MKESASFLKKLFDEKKYLEIVNIIDNEIEKEKLNSGLINLSGVCKLLINKSKNNLVKSIDDFRKSYLKEKNTPNALEALKNFINTSIDLFDLCFSENQEFPKEIFEEILNYLEDNKALFEKNEPFAQAIIRVFKRRLDTDNVIKYLNYFKDSDNADILCSLIYNNCFQNRWDQKKIFVAAKNLNTKFPLYDEKEIPKLENNNDKRINIGFVSADIRDNHSVTYFLKTVLLNYDKQKFKIFLFLNSNKNDETTKNFKDLVDTSIDIHELNDIEAITKIRNLKIDIIFDMMGVTSDYRLALFKNRLAPIQISWCGFCNTTGIDQMDYLIADKNVIKSNEEDLYSEKIIYLSNIWNCHVGFKQEKSEYPPPYKNNNYITFGSFNNFKKINDEVINTWSTILKKVKNSKLILKGSSKASSSLLLKKFESNNVLSSIKLLPFKKNFKNHLIEYTNIDLALDTFPYNGVTTSFEAIWMGVPVLTIKGYNFNSRCGESINKNLKMQNLIAENKEDYILKAIKLSENPVNLDKTRKEIFEKALLSPLFNTNEFSNNFFNILKNLHNKDCL